MIPLWRFGILTLMTIVTISTIILLFHKKLIKGMEITNPHVVLCTILCTITFLISYFNWVNELAIKKYAQIIKHLNLIHE